MYPLKSIKSHSYHLYSLSFIVILICCLLLLHFVRKYYSKIKLCKGTWRSKNETALKSEAISIELGKSGERASKRKPAKEIVTPTDENHTNPRYNFHP